MFTPARRPTTAPSHFVCPVCGADSDNFVGAVLSLMKKEDRCWNQCGAKSSTKIIWDQDHPLVLPASHTCRGWELPHPDIGEALTAYLVANPLPHKEGIFQNRSEGDAHLIRLTQIKEVPEADYHRYFQIWDEVTWWKNGTFLRKVHIHTGLRVPAGRCPYCGGHFEEQGCSTCGAT